MIRFLSRVIVNVDSVQKYRSNVMESRITM